MPKNFSKFIAFAAAHPKLLGRSSLFGAFNEDHTAFKLFVEYIKQQKLIYHQLPQTIGIAEFKAYITSQDATKYQEIIEKIDRLHHLGYLRDQLGQRDLRELAVIFDELGLDQINPRFAESAYNQFLFDTYNYHPDLPQTASSEIGSQKPAPSSLETLSRISPKDAKSDETHPASTLSTTDIDVGGASNWATIRAASAVVTDANKNAAQSAKTTLQADKKLEKDEQLAQQNPQVPNQPQSAESKPTSPANQEPATIPPQEAQAPEFILPEENPLPVLDRAKPTRPENQTKIPDESLNLERVPNTGVSTIPVPQVAVKPKFHQVKRPVKAKTTDRGGQNIRFLDTVSGLRQKAPKQPNFANNQNQQVQQEENVQDNQQVRAQNRVNRPSPGKKLLGRVFKSFAGLGSALALIPNPETHTQALKKIITVALFSLIIAASIPFTAAQPDHFTAYAAPAAAAQPGAAAVQPGAAAPAANVPAAQCPAAPWVSSGPTSCKYPNAPAGTKCPDPFNQESNSGNDLICTQPEQDSAAASAALKNMTEVMVGVQQFLNRALWPVLVMIGGLMDNSLLFGSGMEERLRDIWIPMRNLVNILFVIVLVGIALYNVLGVGGEDGSYSIKSMLPKIVVGIIAVNFSFLGIKVVLDATNAITTSIFALPSDVSISLGKAFDTTTAEGQVMQEKLCAHIQNKTVKELQDAAANPVDPAADPFLANAYRDVASKYWPSKIDKDTTQAQIDQLLAAEDAKQPKDRLITKEDFNKEIDDRKKKQMCSGTTLTTAGREYLENWSSHNAAFAMALNMGGIVFYNEVPFEINSIDKLFTNVLFSMIMYIIYVASFIALFIILLGRLLVMWICVAMSPLLVLVMFSSELKDKVGGFAKLEEQFTKNAFAPIIIAISMTVGWIMLNALKGLSTLSTTGTVSLYSIIPNNGVPVEGLSTLGDFVVALGTIGVVWLGVFGAAEGTIVQDVVGAIGSGLKRAGTFIGTMPLKHLNLVPIKLPGQAPGEPPYTLSELGTAFNELTRDKASDRLYKAITNEKGFSAGTFEDKEVIPEHDTTSFYKGLNKAKTAKLYKNDDFVRLMGDLRRRRHDIYEKLSQGTKDAITAFVNAPADQKEAAFDRLLATRDDNDHLAIQNHPGDLDLKVKNPTPPASGTPPAGGTPGTPPAPGTYHAPPTMSDADIGGRTIDGRTVNQHLQEGNLQPVDYIPPIQTARAAVATALAEIPDTGVASAEQRAALSASMENLRVGPQGPYPQNEAELSGFLGPDNATKVMRVFGGQAGYAGEIQGLEAKQRAATNEAATEERRHTT